MNVIILSVYILAVALGVANLVMEYRRVLMMLQQNSYRNERYTRWLNSSGDTTSMSRLLGMIVLFGSVIKFSTVSIGIVLMLAFFGLNIITLARRRYKKPLVWTRRVARLFWSMSALSALVLGIFVVVVGVAGVEVRLFVGAFGLLALYLLSSVVVMLTNKLLEPVEKSINRRYYDEAAAILRSMPDLKIIGITGSYGKTSTKHYLYRILAESYDVAMTPGSFNTTLGVVRTIREYLKPYNEVFIVEMGAKQPGDIKEICDLVHPSTGIVTAVGEQHLESFGSIENVQRTKFELVDALPSDGLAVLNNDFQYVANREVSNVRCVRYAINATPATDYSVADVRYDATGTTFAVVTPDSRIDLHTRLVGECNISNLVAAVIVALDLGVPVDKIRYAVEKIEQVEHRLNIKRGAGGATIIDDAFNSNPTGSGMALDVLASMTGGKRIVITPGMIELGDRQEYHNRALGRKIAECADVAIVVGHYNRDAIMGGIEDGGMEAGRSHAVDTFADAQRLLASIVAPGDTVLYENDLPDTFK
ncbi:MAG: UDP-N-acetylmuramoyl-tripeptide--D-alanyl-D-alanine ligase [Muribaculaceae bacterium]|nr:UDP-N-acetylmuramoyl-tripeptide--D-alanyl-D-alanine ligase [Muribaculaceae bacterium]